MKITPVELGKRTQVALVDAVGQWAAGWMKGCWVLSLFLKKKKTFHGGLSPHLLIFGQQNPTLSNVHTIRHLHWTLVTRVHAVWSRGAICLHVSPRADRPFRFCAGRESPSVTLLFMTQKMLM